MSTLRALAESIERKEILIPFLKKYLIEEAKLIRAKKVSSREITLKDARMSVVAFKRREKEYNHDTVIEGQYFHPSALGVCMRQLFFGATDAIPNDDDTGAELLRTTVIFETGTYIHVLLQNLCKRAGCLVKREVAIQNEVLGILGHADGIIRIGGRKYLLEIKTINDRGFTMTTEVQPAHKKQIHAYMRALGLDAAVVLYYNKNTQNMKEFVVPYDEAYYRKEVRGRIRHFNRAVEHHFLPAREGEIPTKYPCMFCGFSRLCFDSRALAKWCAQNKITPTVPEKYAPKEKETLYDKKA